MVGSEGPRRSLRDWAVDSLSFVVAILGGFVLYDGGKGDPISSGLLAADLTGMALCLTLWFRRRWPVQLAILAAAVSTFSDTAGATTLMLILTVSIYRQLRTTVLIYCALAGWGLYLRSRRQLLQTLRDRADRAEAMALLRAERGQLQAREEIAREMHDVLVTACPCSACTRAHWPTARTRPPRRCPVPPRSSAPARTRRCRTFAR